MKFSIKTIFVAQLIIAVLLFVILAGVSRVRQRMQMLRMLRENGFTIHFDSQDVTTRGCLNCGWMAAIVGEDGASLVYDVSFRPQAPGRNYNTLGTDFQMPFETVQLSLMDAKWVNDESMRCFANCRKLEVLNIEGTDITSNAIARIRHMDSLQSLFLSETSVDDDCIQWLCEMKNLKLLTVYDTNISKSGVERLRACLPECAIRSDE